MSDAPEDEAAPAAKTPRKRPARRATKTAAAAPAETVVQLSAPEPMASEPAPAPSPAPAAAPATPVEPSAERPRPPRQDDSDSSGDPVATFAEPPSADSQGSGKKRRRRKKNKHGQGQQGGGSGGGQQVFQTAPTQGFSSSSFASAPSSPGHEPREAAQPEGGHHAPAMHAVQRPKLDADQVAKKAWKIFLAEVSEEGLALIGDNDARELSRRSFRLAEVFVEEAMRRQQR